MPRCSGGSRYTLGAHREDAAVARLLDTPGDDFTFWLTSHIQRTARRCAQNQENLPFIAEELQKRALFYAQLIEAPDAQVPARYLRLNSSRQVFPPFYLHALLKAAKDHLQPNPRGSL